MATCDRPGFTACASGRVVKQGAVFEVPQEVIVQGLKAINALPSDAVCVFPMTEGPVVIKANAWRLPVVDEGAAYPRRRARAGKATGDPVE